MAKLLVSCNITTICHGKMLWTQLKSPLKSARQITLFVDDSLGRLVFLGGLAEEFAEFGYEFVGEGGIVAIEVAATEVFGIAECGG